jgi:hypothetical protein
MRGIPDSTGTWYNSEHPRSGPCLWRGVGFSCWTFRVTFRSFVKYLLQLDSEITRPKVVWCTQSFGRVILMGHRSSEPCRLVTWSCFLFWILNPSKSNSKYQFKFQFKDCFSSETCSGVARIVVRKCDIMSK